MSAPKNPLKITRFIVEIKHGKGENPKYMREDLLELWKWDDDVKVKVKRLQKEQVK